MIVLKVVDQDVADKIDTEYIAGYFADMQNVHIVFICTQEGGEEDSWTDESGIYNIIIHLPYKAVAELTDIRPMMLERVEEALGLVA